MSTNIQKLRDRRQELGLSQIELAQKAEVHRSTIIDIENGNQSPSFDLVEKITEAMDGKIEIRWNHHDKYAVTVEKLVDAFKSSPTIYYRALSFNYRTDYYKRTYMKALNQLIREDKILILEKDTKSMLCQYIGD